MRSKSHAPATISAQPQPSPGLSATLSHPMGEGTRARSRFQEDQRFNIDLAATENFTFRSQWIRAYPHAVLQVAEAFVPQVAAQPFALGVLSGGHVEEHQPPLTVPRPRPAFLRVAPAQDVQSSLGRQPIEPVIRGTGVMFQELLSFQGVYLAQEAVAIGPAFVGIGQVAKGRAREQVGGPKQEVQKFLSLGLHGGSMEE